MENFSKIFADAARPTPWIDGVPQPREYWPMARAEHIDLGLMRTQRVNLLLMGTERVVQDALDRLMPTLRHPIDTWRPGERLVLPPAAQFGTLILRHVGGLSPVDQYELVRWLELSGGRTQVISTTITSLLHRVEAGAFLDTLYYRLNTVCVDVTG